MASLACPHPLARASRSPARTRVERRAHASRLPARESRAVSARQGRRGRPGHSSRSLRPSRAHWLRKKGAGGASWESKRRARWLKAREGREGGARPASVLVVAHCLSKSVASRHGGSVLASPPFKRQMRGVGREVRDARGSARHAARASCGCVHGAPKWSPHCTERIARDAENRREGDFHDRGGRGGGARGE